MFQALNLNIINALTGIRFLVAMLVFLFHFGAGFSERINAPQFISTFLYNGKIGVSMFFVLSGFILTYNYTKIFANQFNFKVFFLARFARIYPVYLLALIIMLPILPKALDWLSAMCVLFMVQSWTSPYSNFGGTWVMQAWSLSVELFFYLCFPILFSLMRELRLRIILLGLLSASLFIVVFGTPWIDPGIAFIPLFSKDSTPILPILRLPEFIFGMLLCKLIFAYPKLGDMLAGLKFFTLTFVSIVILLSFAETVQIKTVATLLFGVLIIQLSYGKNLIVRILSSQQMVLLGGASYALYMIQGPVRHWFYWLVSNDILSKMASMFLNPITAIFLSIMIFIYYEQPNRKCLMSFVRN
jgi:hypothetical protein